MDLKQANKNYATIKTKMGLNGKKLAPGALITASKQKGASFKKKSPKTKITAKVAYTPGGDRTEGAIPPAKVKAVIKKKELTPYQKAVKTSGRNSPHARAQSYITAQKRLFKRTPTIKEVENRMYPKKAKK